MISQDSILIAQPIAEELVSRNQTLLASTGSVIAGLNEQTTTVKPFKYETLSVDVPKVTVMGSDMNRHSEMKDELTDLIAPQIRRSFTYISKYLAPFAGSLGNRLEEKINSYSGPTGIIFNRFRMEIVRTDVPIFSSTRYPEKPNNDLIDFSHIDKNVLSKKGTYEWIEKEKILDYVQVSDSEISAFLSKNIDKTCGALNAILVDNDYRELGQPVDGKGPENKGYIDTNTLKPCINVEGLFGAYIVLTKMRTDDNPVPWVSDVSLDDYRAAINLLWHAVTNVLAGARYRYAEMSKIGVMVDHRKAEIFYNEKQGFGKLPFISGTVYVYVSDAAIAAAGDYGFSERVVGYLLARIAFKAPGTEGFDQSQVEIYQEAFSTYLQGVHESMKTHASGIIRQVIGDCLTEFKKDHPEFNQIITLLNNEPDYMKLPVYLEKDIQLFISDCMSNCVEGQHNYREFTSGHIFVSAFARAIGLDMAGDILARTAVCVPNDTVEAKRERLNVAVTEVIIGRLLNPNK